jgi:Fur family zinc uptake transcriptional regulator
MVMAHAHSSHANGSAEDLIAQAERLCVDKRLQLTPLRRRVFEALAASEAPLGAYDLVERLGVERRVAPISVYRALDFLIEAGLIHRIATQNSYLPCHHSHDAHEATLFLVCKTCGHVDEVSSVDVARGIDGTAAAAGFRTGHRPVEIEGECQTCQVADKGRG